MVVNVGDQSGGGVEVGVWVGVLAEEVGGGVGKRDVAGTVGAGCWDGGFFVRKGGWWGGGGGRRHGGGCEGEGGAAKDRQAEEFTVAEEDAVHGLLHDERCCVG